ncbi:hypothetical protein LSAT2_023434 [Lamellibrachia satsuma]|nr:hypothetical protein LSAT2_023434 [Lamellibrachia satsuma]
MLQKASINRNQVNSVVIGVVDRWLGYGPVRIRHRTVAQCSKFQIVTLPKAFTQQHAPKRTARSGPSIRADDTVFMSHSEVALQTIHDRFAAASAYFGISINVRKTEPLNVAATFKYLGNTIANDCSLDKELSARIQSASAAFGRLREQLWNKHNIKLVTKCKAERNVGIRHLRYMDCTKRHLHAADINKRHWDEMAHARSAWQKLKPKEQPMPKSNDNAAMDVRSRLQIEQISSQSSHADTAERNWRLVLANYPMKELVRGNVGQFAMLMPYSKPRRPPMIYQTRSETVIQQPVVATSALQQYRESPVRTMCPYCRARILTVVRYDVGTYTWLICAIVFFLTGSMGCCIFPFCIDECKDVVHFCPSCEQQIARWNRM